MKREEKKTQERKPSRPIRAPRIERDNDLEHAELAGEEDRSPSTDSSETDEDDREGSGDGNSGRSTRNR
jgi:hypothetical protein